MIAPAGLAGIIAFYGDPLAFLMKDGRVSSFWELGMVYVPMPFPLQLGWNLAQHATRVRVHAKLEEIVGQTFEDLARGPWSRLRTYDGAYEWRTQRGEPGKLSLHAYGAAIDFDAGTNRQGRMGDMHPEVVEVFESHGWTWGGRFKPPRIDPMHFQYATGY